MRARRSQPARPREVQEDPAVRAAYLGGGSRRLEPRTAAAEGAALLEGGRLETGYGAEPVLKGIDVRVNADELVAVLGANGAGKSTFMRSLAGLQPPSARRDRPRGRNLATLPAHRVVARGMVLVPEGRQVFPELSVLDNIRLGGYLRRDVPEGSRGAARSLPAPARAAAPARGPALRWRATDAPRSRAG